MKEHPATDPYSKNKTQNERKSSFVGSSSYTQFFPIPAPPEAQQPEDLWTVPLANYPFNPAAANPSEDTPLLNSEEKPSVAPVNFDHVLDIPDNAGHIQADDNEAINNDGNCCNMACCCEGVGVGPYTVGEVLEIIGWTICGTALGFGAGWLLGGGFNAACTSCSFDNDWAYSMSDADLDGCRGIWFTPTTSVTAYREFYGQANFDLWPDCLYAWSTILSAFSGVTASGCATAVVYERKLNQP